MTHADEWETLHEIRQKRVKEGHKEQVADNAPLPFDMWVPAYKRHKLFETVINMCKNSDGSKRSGLGSLIATSKYGSLTEQWKQTQDNVRGQHDRLDPDTRESIYATNGYFGASQRIADYVHKAEYN
jgi:hypothetical protein